MSNSTRSSTWSESAASELDPLFLSLKELPIRPSASNSNHQLSPSTSSSHSPPPLPTTVNFPLPPRRLRPGELIDIPDPLTTNGNTSPTQALFTPVSLYGVAIGGNNPINKNHLTINGRAEVKTIGMTSLDLRKMSLRNRPSISLSPSPQPSTTEIISLRAKNPTRILAPPQTPSIHSPTPSYSHDQPNLPRAYQPVSTTTNSAYNHLPTHSFKFNRPSRSPSQPNKPSLPPPRNLSLVETTSNPIPRLPPTRLNYQSLSYNLSTSPDPLHHHNLSSIRQPLSEALSSDLNINPNPYLRRHPLLSSSPTPQNDSDSLPLTMHHEPAGHVVDRSNGRIKFAPLPNKSIPLGLPVPSSLASSEPQNIINGPRESPKKKAAWIQRWLSPATKPVAAKSKPDISLPVPETLILTGTGAVTSPARVSSTNVKRRNSVNDQESPPKPVVRRERPRSRSFSAGRPSLGMVANLARTPSRSIQDTVVSGRPFLTGSQFVTSPTRAHSLHNLIGYNPVPKRQPNPSSNLLPPSSSEVSAENNQLRLGNTTQSDLSQDTQPRKLQHVPMSNSNEQQADGSTNTKNKREIRFRNTLELIPDLVFPDSPPAETDLPQNPSPHAPTEPFVHHASHSDLQAMDLMSSDHKRRKTSIKNLGLFNHLRRPRTVDTYDGLEPSGTSRNHEFGRRTLQPLGSSHSHSMIQPMSALLPSKSRTNQQLSVSDQDNVSLLTRKLAPKVNLTFVDLDHHIGSRFSVNTLLKEVNKSIPDLTPHDGDSFRDVPKIDERSKQLTRIENPATQYSDPGTRQEIIIQSREREGSGSEPRSDGRDGSSSDNPGSPTTATSVSNPTEVETSKPAIHHSSHDSIIEVVKTDGADIVFQMVVPVAATPVKQTRSRQPGRQKVAAVERLEVPGMACEEDALTVISERLVALNKSIETHQGRHSRVQTPEQVLSVPRSSSSTRRPAAPTGVVTRKNKKIENWLSNVPSPQTSPAPHVNEFFPLNQHNPQLHHSQLLLSTQLHQEVLDHPDLLDCPESPIDKLHRHLPSRLTMHRSSRSPTPTHS